MFKQNINIIGFETLYNILEEIKTNLSFEIYRIHPSGVKKINNYSWFEEMFIASNLICINKKFIK